MSAPDDVALAANWLAGFGIYFWYQAVRWARDECSYWEVLLASSLELLLNFLHTATITVNRLEPDTPYTFMVTSFNSVGQSEAFVLEHRTPPVGKYMYYVLMHLGSPLRRTTFLQYHECEVMYRSLHAHYISQRRVLF